MDTLLTRLNRITDLYCRAVGLSRSRVSTLIYGSGSRLDGVACGRDLNTRSYERAIRWFSENWPEGNAWPEDIERISGSSKSCDVSEPAVSGEVAL